MKSGGKLVVLMITAFIDMVGMLMIIPLMPFYAKSLGANGFVVGLLVASFSIAQLLSAPWWGRISDKYGRRPALLVGLAGSAIAYVIFGFASSLWLLFLSRFVQGAGGGTVGVVQAYVADSVEPEERAKALGWLSAATNAGVALGPGFAPFFAHHWGHAGPGLAAAALCVVNIGFAARFLVESRDMVAARALKPKRGASREAVVHAATHITEPAPRLIWIYAVGMGAFSGMNAVLALFLNAQFNVTADTIGYFFEYVGVISVVTRAGILGWAVDRFGEARLSKLGQALLAIGLAAIPFTRLLADPAAVTTALGGFLPHRLFGFVPYLPLALAVGLIPLGTAFTFPCVTAMLSHVVSSNERGLYMGVQQTFGGIARVLFPIIAGAMFDWSHAAPFLMSSVLVAGTIILGLPLQDIGRPRGTPKAAAAT